MIHGLCIVLQKMQVDSVWNCLKVLGLNTLKQADWCTQNSLMLRDVVKYFKSVVSTTEGLSSQV